MQGWELLCELFPGSVEALNIHLKFGKLDGKGLDALVEGTDLVRQIETLCAACLELFLCCIGLFLELLAALWQGVCHGVRLLCTLLPILHDVANKP